MATALRRYHDKDVPQSEQANSRQVQNNAGGYGYQVDNWTQLRRFLIMGTDGGTYYVGERELTQENLNSLVACSEENPWRVIREIEDVLKNNLSPKPEYAIYALAFMTGHNDAKIRREATEKISYLLKTGTHLFQFASFVENFRGWGATLRKGVAKWYTDKNPRQLAYQVTKYQQRHGWSHRDLLRLAHPKVAGEKNELLRLVTQGLDKSYVTVGPNTKGINYWLAANDAKAAGRDETIELIRQHNLTREMVNTEHLSDPAVQSALLEGMPVMATLRNLANMTRSGLFKNWSMEHALVIDRLTSEPNVRKSGIHPIVVLNALKTYQEGGGFRGQNTWEPDADIVQALNETFRLSFGNIEPANKKTLIGLDVSGSMSFSAPSGFENLTCAEAAAAMLMATYESEPYVKVMAFSDRLKPFNISRGMDLNSILKETDRINFGRTDCAQPMLYAKENGLDIDTFIVYTDSETWYGSVHPDEALRQYRRAMNKPDAKLIVVAMQANLVSIADPEDAGMLDVSGFDASVPNIISQFSAGEL